MTRFHRHATRGVGLVLHRLATAAMGTAVIAAVLAAAGAWRLAQGPVDIGWFTHRLEAAVNANGGPVRLSIGGTALAWEGFRLGVDRPLDLRLTDIRVTGAGGVRPVDIPRAEVSLALRALLLGRIQPRALELDMPRLTLRRDQSGTIRLAFGAPEAPNQPLPGNGAAMPAQPSAGSSAATPAVPSAGGSAATPAPAAAPGTATPAQRSAGSGAPTPAQSSAGIGTPLPALLAALARPPASDRTAGPAWYSQLQRLRIRDAGITVIDQPLGLTWQAPRADVTLLRNPGGGMAGTADLTLALGSQTARLTGSATLSPDAARTTVVARMTPVEPAALADAAPALGFLAAVAAPVSAQATAELGPTLGLQRAQVTLQAGAGTLRIAAGRVPILGASIVASGTPDSVDLNAATVRLQARPGETPSTVTAAGTLRRGDGRIEADLTIGLDHVAFADLPTLWPAGVGGGARPWVLENITAGTARDGHFALGLAANADLSDLTLTRMTGSVLGTGLTVAWLRPAPPIVQANAVLRVLDPNSLQIDLASGQQIVRGGTAIVLTGGSVRIDGLMQPDQTAAIQVAATGGLAGIVALLREPRLQLLSRHPVGFTDPSGTVTETVTAKVPLDANVQMDDIPVHVAAHIANAALAGVVAGRDLTDGTLDLDATNNGLTIKGQGRLAGIPASLDATMDFRAGPPTQVLQRVTVTGRPDARQLATAGLDATDALSGPIGLRAVVTEQRDGSGAVSVDADLADATLTVAPLDWRQRLGAGARASAVVRLQHDRLAGIGDVSASGDGVTLRGEVRCNDGRIAMIRLDRLVLGRSDVAGTIALPASPRDGPIVVRLNGPVLDLSPRLDAPASPPHPHPRPRPEPPPGPPWTLEARFGRVLMAHGTMLMPLSVQAENDGRVFRRLHIAGATRANGAFALQIAPEGGRRRLTASVAQAGDLLRALGVTGTMQGGSLTLSGAYDDAAPGDALRGTLDLTDFRVARAAVLGKLLQAMTLYGLVDALRGPGLTFHHMVAPFTLSDGLLQLSDVRAFSPSLGLTAKGALDLDANTIDLQGTIVPAYFFNSLLGNVPLVGRLFSPERGGGVFAASYGLHGSLDDPAVSVNPLTALTPGFLRGLFGLF